MLLASRRFARSQGASHDYDNTESNHSAEKRLKQFRSRCFYIYFLFFENLYVSLEGEVVVGG